MAMVNLLTVEETKVCTRCGERKPIGEFTKNWGACRSCRIENCKKWREKNREYHKQYCRDYHKKNAVKLTAYRAANFTKRRDAFLRFKYGITLEEYNGLFDLQNGRCAACGGNMVKGGKSANRAELHHCHVTGHNQDLLCKHCNMAEGMLRTADRAQRLADYMRKNELTLFPKREKIK
jgi:hypothetical protein